MKNETSTKGCFTTKGKGKTFLQQSKPKVLRIFILPNFSTLLKSKPAFCYFNRNKLVISVIIKISKLTIKIESITMDHK